jgi:hypothetical protein
MTFDDVPEEAWVAKIKDLEDRVSALETHRNICDHPRVEEDWVFNGDDEVRVYTCLACGETV